MFFPFSFFLLLFLCLCRYIFQIIGFLVGVFGFATVVGESQLSGRNLIIVGVAKIESHGHQAKTKTSI